MRRMGLFLVFLSLNCIWARADECEAVAQDLRVPVKLKARGKPARARWEQVDKVFTTLRDELQGKECEFKFEHVFAAGKEELYFPLTNNLVRTVPESALKGLEIFNPGGALLGQYEGRVMYERTGGLYAKNAYTLFYFQFKDQNGELQSTGNRLLLDDFLVKWKDLKERVAISTK